MEGGLLHVHVLLTPPSARRLGTPARPCNPRCKHVREGCKQDPTLITHWDWIILRRGTNNLRRRRTELTYPTHTTTPRNDNSFLALLVWKSSVSTGGKSSATTSGGKSSVSTSGVEILRYNDDRWKSSVSTHVTIPPSVLAQYPHHYFYLHIPHLLTRKLFLPRNKNVLPASPSSRHLRRPSWGRRRPPSGPRRPWRLWWQQAWLLILLFSTERNWKAEIFENR